MFPLSTWLLQPLQVWYDWTLVCTLLLLNPFTQFTYLYALLQCDTCFSSNAWYVLYLLHSILKDKLRMYRYSYQWNSRSYNRIVYITIGYVATSLGWNTSMLQHLCSDISRFRLTFVVATSLCSHVSTYNLHTLILI